MREHVSLKEAADVLRKGDPLIFDTDTVPGIGISIERPESLHLLYDAKTRDREKPVAWLVESDGAIDEFGDNVADYARKIAAKFWPGALTIIIKAAPGIDASLLSKEKTIGLRVPDNERCLALLHELGCPIATTSANLSGDIDAIDAGSVSDDFAKGVPAMEEVPQRSTSDDCEPFQNRDDRPREHIAKKASTVIDCTQSRPCLKREGAIPFSDIIEALEENTGEGQCA